MEEPVPAESPVRDIPPIIGPATTWSRIRDYDLGSITPELVHSTMRGVRAGNLEFQERLFAMMGDTWPMYQKCRQEVAGAVARLEWCVMPFAEKGKDPTPEAQAQADLLEKAIAGCKPNPEKVELGFTGYIKALLDAYGKGHVVCETLWEITPEMVRPRAFAPLPARYYRYPMIAGDKAADQLMLNPSGMSNFALEEFTPGRFTIAKWQMGNEHPVKAGMLRSLSKYWLGAYFGLGWLMQYAQLFGIPWRWAEVDTNNPKAVAAAMEALQNIGAGGFGCMPKGSLLHIENSVSGGESLPQKTVLDIADEAVQILYLGQTLTTTQGDRGSQALGTVHSNMRDDALANAKDWVAGVINEQFVPAFIAFNYGPEAAAGPMPYLMAKMPEARDVTADLEEVKTWKDLKLPVTKQQVYDKLQVPPPGEGDDLYEWPEAPDPLGPDGAGADEEGPEPVEAARKGARGKRRGLVVWSKR